ncbi:peptidoglycan DD-metalloendopeptidase family protein [Candidatus Chloroploca sp. M-50]|uniref:Peptidoglycan DD-metalloendopeptidase family protein n=2 Tax=Candidatus Chloroploca mongolica TaxID=2528176 RepID=A0ABS4D7D1_9CHLR|nr:peptidoglycan DD-metalloendopeptidase family protein [Candidatus Chloroploca mongolica]
MKLPFRAIPALVMTLILVVACAAPPPPAATPVVEVPPTSTVVATPTSTRPEQSVATSAPEPTALPTATPEPRDPLFDPRRLSYAHNFNGAEIQALLETYGSPVRDMRFQIGNRSHSFTDVLYSLTTLYSINPQLLLALMDMQSGLVRNPSAGPDQFAAAMGYRGANQGVYGQLRRAAREVRAAVREYALRGDNPPPPLVFADGSRQEVSGEIAFNRYVLARMLAPTTTPDMLSIRIDQFIASYTRLFSDPREPPSDWPPLAEPFLNRPMERNFRVTSFFDHDAPFLRTNGSLHTFWGREETDRAFAYDGHTGWDYAMAPPDRILAAADGLVTFAGNSDDGCATAARAVILDHGNGYRTLYWHLDSLNVTAGQVVTQGEVLGIAGDTGCSIGAHLHLQVQYLGRDVDPYGWCGSGESPWVTSPAGQTSVWLWADMPSPCEAPPPGVVIVHNASPGFATTADWQSHEIGYEGGSSFIATNFAGSSTRPWQPASLRQAEVVIWEPELPAAGRYHVMAYIPYALNGLDETREARYLIRHRDGESVAVIDAEVERNWWADLGIYEFDPATALVSSSNLAGDSRRGMWADAVAFVPVQP